MESQHTAATWHGMVGYLALPVRRRKGRSVKELSAEGGGLVPTGGVDGAYGDDMEACLELDT